MKKLTELERKDPYIVSFLELRQGLGFLGITFPFILIITERLLFQQGIQDSISYYYHTDMRNVFVGILFAIAFFLWAYKGYERIDVWACRIAAVAAIGVALFPTPLDLAYKGFAWHYVFAGVFLFALTYISWALFTRTHPPKQSKRQPITPRKKYRNRVYRACAIAMSVCLVLIVASNVASDVGILKVPNLTFYLESIALIAFGISWITKGQLILKDEEKKVK